MGETLGLLLRGLIEFVLEVLIRGVLELVILPVTYSTGSLVLWAVSAGKLRLSPLGSMGQTNRGISRWKDWSIWLRRSDGRRELKAECVVIAGFLFFFAAGAGLVVAARGSEPESAGDGVARNTSTGGANTGQSVLCWVWSGRRTSGMF